MFQSKKSALFMINIAFICFSFAGIIGQAVSVSAVAVVAFRVMFSSCILGSFLFLTRKKILPNTRKDMVLALLAGALLGFHWVSFFTSIKASSVAIALITFGTAPLFVALIEPVVFREKFQPKTLLFALIAIVGVLIATPEFSMENSVTVGIVWGLIASFTYGILTLFNRALSVNYSGAQVCFWEHFIAMLVTMPVAIYSGINATQTDILLLAIMGLVCTALGFSLVVQCQKVLPSQLVVLMSGVETVYSIVLAYFLLNETPALRQLLGGLVIFGVVTFASHSSKVNEKKELEV